MICFLIGRFTRTLPTQVEVEVGGVGYELYVPLSTYDQVKEKEEGKLYTYLHVSDSAHLLYGFATEQEKRMFLKLISVSGIGPSTALAALSSYSAEELRRLIQSEEIGLIQKIKGIGKKTAQRLVLELSDKLPSSEVEVDKKTDNIYEEALQALVALGLSRGEAERNIREVRKKSSDSTMSLEELLKAALHASK